MLTLATALSAGNTPGAASANINTIGDWFGDMIGGGSGMGLLNRSATSGDFMNAIGATSSGPLSSSNAYANEWWM